MKDIEKRVKKIEERISYIENDMIEMKIDVNVFIEYMNSYINIVGEANA